METTGDVAEALADHRDYLAGETLAVSVTTGRMPDGFSQEAEIEGTPVAITIRKARAT